MKKILIFISFLVLISSCAMPPKPTTKNPARVTFNFSGNGKSALTFWRKLNDDGTKGGVFSVGGSSRTALMLNTGFSYPYSETVTLDAGTYYMDSYQIATNNGFIVSQNAHYLLRNGWDKEKNKPFYLSFTIKDGENVILPRVEMNAEPGSFIKIKFNYNDENKIFTIGTRAEKLK